MARKATSISKKTPTKKTGTKKPAAKKTVTKKTATKTVVADVSSAGTIAKSPRAADAFYPRSKSPRIIGSPKRKREARPVTISENIFSREKVGGSVFPLTSVAKAIKFSSMR
ncbi:MAG: hypothetical protein MUO21_04925, partial [Nitrososphaeraceae archaeon]|nr:hypothetical protein [Nitrososphaeraceae archaeon]